MHILLLLINNLIVLLMLANILMQLIDLLTFSTHFIILVSTLIIIINP